MNPAAPPGPPPSSASSRREVRRRSSVQETSPNSTEPELEASLPQQEVQRAGWRSEVKRSNAKNPTRTVDWGHSEGRRRSVTGIRRDSSEGKNTHTHTVVSQQVVEAPGLRVLLPWHLVSSHHHHRSWDLSGTFQVFPIGQADSSSSSQNTETQSSARTVHKCSQSDWAPGTFCSGPACSQGPTDHQRMTVFSSASQIQAFL